MKKGSQVAMAEGVGKNTRRTLNCRNETERRICRIELLLHRKRSCVFWRNNNNNEKFFRTKLTNKKKIMMTTLTETIHQHDSL